MGLSCGVDHTLDTACAFTVNATCANGTGQVVFHIDAEPGQPIHLTKYITYHTSRTNKTGELEARAVRTLDRVLTHGSTGYSKTSVPISMISGSAAPSRGAVRIPGRSSAFAGTCSSSCKRSAGPTMPECRRRG